MQKFALSLVLALFSVSHGLAQTPTFDPFEATIPADAQRRSRPAASPASNWCSSVLIQNADGTRNSAANPARKGSLITFYLTGDGIPNTLGIDGRPAAAPLQRPVQTALVSVNSALVTLPYAGAAPGYAGIMQVNAQLDANTPSGSLPLIVQVGSKSSTPVNLFVQ